MIEIYLLFYSLTFTCLHFIILNFCPISTTISHTNRLLFEKMRWNYKDGQLFQSWIGIIKLSGKHTRWYFDFFANCISLLFSSLSLFLSLALARSYSLSVSGSSRNYEHTYRFSVRRANTSAIKFAAAFGGRRLASGREIGASKDRREGRQPHSILIQLRMRNFCCAHRFLPRRLNPRLAAIF